MTKGRIALLLLLSLFLLCILLSLSSPLSTSSFPFSSHEPAAPEMMMMRGKMAGGARNMMMNSGGDASFSSPSFQDSFATMDASREMSAEMDAPANPQKRMIARTATIEIQVDHPVEAGKKFEEFILEKKGFLSSFSDSGDSAFVHARIPVESLEEAIEFARQLAKVVIRIYKEGNDVTEEFVDQKARLDNAKAARDRLLQLMEKAKEVQEILQIERELNQITERIESFKARSDYLEQTTSLSSISLNLFKTYEPPGPIESWSPFQTFKRAFETLGRALKLMLDISIYFVVIVLPIFLGIALLAYLGNGCWMRHSRKESS